MTEQSESDRIKDLEDALRQAENCLIYVADVVPYLVGYGVRADLIQKIRRLLRQ